MPYTIQQIVAIIIIIIVEVGRYRRVVTIEFYVKVSNKKIFILFCLLLKMLRTK